ncbi:unnamed protein product [Brachionus calyciflorus]|uniref:Uncharacterized protein n=1 Tax=Brachionus calyciflorus TaxID=104777 RepID=A0A813MCB5_9BILA|nr:unnamed protein product [Brachionus calyciflorus]
MSVSSLFQSEYVLALGFTFILGLIGVVTYFFSFKQSEPKQSEPETTPKKTVKTKLKESKTKVQKTEPTEPVKKVEEPAKKVETVKKVEEPVKTVKKTETVNKKTVKKEVKKTVVEEPVVQTQNEEPVVDASGWTTVVDKRSEKKKQKSATPEAPVVQNKKEAKSVEVVQNVEVVNNNQLVIGAKQPSSLLTESVIERTETKEKEDDWIPANPKSKKDKKKEKKEAVVEVDVKPQEVVPVVPEVKEVKSKKSKNKSAAQNLAHAIQDAIVDTVESKNPKVNLKQTSLTDSIILIEKENKRTESNQSSNDSLQDIDGDDGFITITNKKSKKNVRREQ